MSLIVPDRVRSYPMTCSRSGVYLAMLLFVVVRDAAAALAGGRLFLPNI